MSAAASILEAEAAAATGRAIGTTGEQVIEDDVTICAQEIEGRGGPVLDRLQEELEPWFEATPRCQGDFYGLRTTRFGSVLLKSEESHSLALHTLMLSIMDSVLGPQCDWYQLNLTQAVRLHPGQRQQVPRASGVHDGISEADSRPTTPLDGSGRSS